MAGICNMLHSSNSTGRFERRGARARLQRRRILHRNRLIRLRSRLITV